jgi:hypothetical protein
MVIHCPERELMRPSGWGSACRRVGTCLMLYSMGMRSLPGTIREAVWHLHDRPAGRVRSASDAVARISSPD